MPAWKKERLLKAYRQMLLIRRFEEAAAKAYSQKKIRGFCHLYIGEESVAVGAISTLDESDYVLATYREHGHALAKGMEARGIMAELFGRETGCSRGRGGSMHLFDVEKKFYGGHGIVGGHVAVAAGVAFASQYRRERSVTLCFLGEGATNIGGFHEGLSLASLWSLPAVFIIENNLYAMGTPLYRSQRLDNLSEKALGYGMAHDRVDAANVRDVHECVKKAVNRARSEKGPTLIEAITYRFRGHSMSDPAKYRTEKELESRKQQDPLLITVAELREAGMTEEEFSSLESEIRKEVEDAVNFAENSPFPEIADLNRHVYSQP